MLRLPKDSDALGPWAQEITDEMLTSSDERAMILTRASQLYYQGCHDSRAAIFNKCKPFIDKLAGFLMQPTDIRFSIIYDSTEPEDVLQRAQVAAEKLTADYRQTDSDIKFAEAVTWALINGCQIIKHTPDKNGFKVSPIHTQHFGVLSETTVSLDEQEAFVHVSYPTVSQLRAMLDEGDYPNPEDVIAQVLQANKEERSDEEPTYFHQMVVGGMQPLGDINDTPSAAGIVSVFPTPTPWRPQKRIWQTVRFCEVWIKDADRDGDYTTIQMVYPDILIEGKHTRRNLSKIPGHHPFTKVQAAVTPGYFWGRSLLADVQMLQEVLNKRLRDLKVMWDRNANAPQILSGFTGITEEMYFKIISEGGFISDPNPNAKAQKMIEPPPPGYMEELEFIWQMFDEASGFSPVMSGQGEPGVRAGIHAQTLVRTSSPRLIDQAVRIERQLADSGYLSLRLMQAMDPSIYSTDQGTEFLLKQLPDDFQVTVDSHSASPAFAEDNRQVAIALARAGAIDSEDLIRMLHPPGSELLLARLRDRQKAQAEQAKKDKQEEMTRDVLHLSQHKPAGQGGKKR
jgi:hypothetical protein